MNRFNPLTRCTPVSEWPETDRRLWLQALAPKDVFELSNNPAEYWKPSTRKHGESGYGGWLGWLSRTGNLAPEVSPGSRATRESVKEYLAFLRSVGLADNTVGGRLQCLGNVLRAIAPDGDWNWILRAASRIHADAKLVRDPIDRMQPAEAVLKLSQDLMDAAEGRFRTAIDQATLHRDGLIIAILTRRVWRSANLSALTLGVHLEKRGDAWVFRTPGEETKNGQPIHSAWPESLNSALERYLTVHRPVLLRCGARRNLHTEALWVSKQGTGMTPSAILFQVNSRTREAFGKAINPHTFRHIAATTIAMTSPSNMHDAMHVLGHTSPAASNKHYNRANMLGAAELWQGRVDEMRKRKPRDRYAPPP